MAETAEEAGRKAGAKMDEASGKAKSTMKERVVEPIKAAGEAVKASGQKAAEGTSAVSMKMIDHAETNTLEAFRAMRAAANAGNVADVMKIQGDYIREQGNRSMTQVREIGEVIANFGREAMAPLTGKKDG